LRIQSSRMVFSPKARALLVLMGRPPPDATAGVSII